MMFPLIIAALFAAAWALGTLIAFPCSWLQRPAIERYAERERSARDLEAWLSQRDAEVRRDQRQRPPPTP